MADTTKPDAQGSETTPLPPNAPGNLRVNLVELPADVYPPPAPAPPPAPRKKAAAPSVNASPEPWHTTPGAPSRPFSPPQDNASPAIAPVPAPSQPSSPPPSEAMGGVLDLVTVPALVQIGFKPDEVQRLMGGVKDSLDIWSEGGAKEALPVPPTLQKLSKVADKLLPVAQEVVLPRLPFIIEGIRDVLGKNEPPPGPAPPPLVDPHGPAARTRPAPASLKEAVKAKAGETSMDGGKVIGFPEEAREPDFARLKTSDAPREGAYSGPREAAPPKAFGGTGGASKIQFYGAKETPPGQERTLSSAAEYEHPGPSRDDDVRAIANLPVQGASHTPANSPEGTWADERRESIEPHETDAPLSLDALLGNVPGTREIRENHARQATPTMTQSRMTPQERDLILGALKKYDPTVIGTLVMTGMDVSGFALAAKDKITPDQRARIKALTFEDVLSEADAMSGSDADFSQRWAKINTPAGRKWLKKNLQAVQAGL